MCKGAITPTNSKVFYKDHGIMLSSNYFNSKQTKPRGIRRLSLSRTNSKTTTTTEKEASAAEGSTNSTNNKPATVAASASNSGGGAGSETEIPVCIAAAMHLHIAFPADYVVVSPVCFVSLRCEHTCRVTLELPHALANAAAVKRENKKEREVKRLEVFSFVTFDLKQSTQVESPSPVERSFEAIRPTSLDIDGKVVRFKTTMENPRLFAVGVRVGGGGGVPRPLVPLKCAVFCLYRLPENQPTVSIIPVWIYVGLNLKTLTAVSIFTVIINELPHKSTGWVKGQHHAILFFHGL